MRDPSMSDQTPSALERERPVVTALLLLQLVLWLGFAVHRSPRFSGSAAGTSLGIAGAIVMVLPSIMYGVVKRLPILRRVVTRHLSLRSLLALHVWGGLVGSILAIVHTGHRFESRLGLALTGVMLLTVFSGYVGRHFLGKVSGDVRGKQELLEQLVTAYNSIASQLAVQAPGLATVSAFSPWSRLRRRIGLAPSESSAEALSLADRAIEVTGSIADLEYAIGTDEALKDRFRTWFAVHVATSLVFYALLALHVWAAFYFGLRWLA